MDRPRWPTGITPGYPGTVAHRQKPVAHRLLREGGGERDHEVNEDPPAEVAPQQVDEAEDRLCFRMRGWRVWHTMYGMWCNVYYVFCIVYLSFCKV